MQNMSATSQNSGGNTMDQAQSGHANGNDWREEVFQKIKSMKDMYFSDMNDMSQKIAAKLQQHDSLQQPKTEQHEKLKLFKAMLDRSMGFLQLNKSSILISHKEKLPLYEKQIVSLVSSNRPRKPVSSLQQGLLPQPHMQSMQRPQSQIYQVQSHTTETGHANGNDWKGEVYQRRLMSQNIQNSSGVQRSASLSSALPSASSLAQTSVPSVIGQKRNLQNMSATSQNSGGNIMVQASLDSTAQTGHANGGDWKEEVYQKIKSMKEIYFADLDDMSQKIAVTLQEHDSLQQPKTEQQLRKLKLFKAMLDRTMAFLQLNKSNIVIGHKDKLPLYEKQIINLLGSVSTMQQNNVSSLQQNSVSYSSEVPSTQKNMMSSLQSNSNMDSGQGK